MAAAPVELLERAVAAVDELAKAELDGLSAEALNEAVACCQRLRAKVDAVEAAVLARWDAERAWQLDGAKTGAAWIAWRTRVPIQDARQRVRHARGVRDLPAVAQAWAAGEIDRAQVTTLLGARNPRTAKAFATEHKVLLDAARLLGFVDFKRTCERWKGIVDPDGAEQGAADEEAGREVHLAQSWRGMWFGKLTFDRVRGQIVGHTLEAIERELFEADWRDAKERLGRDPLASELARTPAQRRADAMVEMAIRARTAPKDGRRPAPLFTVIVDHDTLAGPVLELFNRTVITPGTAARWLTEADVERIVFGLRSRILDVSERRRFFTGALRRGVVVRDRTCFHPTCDEVPDRPEVDHILEASLGGPTSEGNAQLGCGHHNRDRYRRRQQRRRRGRDPDHDTDQPA